MPPSNPEARLALAFQHLKAGRLPVAEKLSRELASQRPQDARARALLARVLNLSGRADEARDQVAAALALDPAFPPALIEQAQLARASGDHELAVIALERLTVQQPANPALAYDLAVSLLELDRVDQAEQELWRVLALAPNLIDARFKLGLVAVRRGDSRGALEQFRTCCETRPGWIEAWLNRGAMLLNLEQPRAAADAYGRALDLDFDNAHALEGYASAERELGGGMERIIQVRLRVTERSPDSPLAWHQLAEAYSSNSQLREHAEAAERALALDPTFLTARFALFQEPPDLVYPDRAAQERFVERWRDGLQFFEQVDLGVPAHRSHLPLILARQTNFHLHYMGEPYVDLQRRYAAVIGRMAHALVSPAAAAEVPRQPRDSARLRVGVVSPFMRRHTVSKLFRSLIEGLPRSRFSIELFHCGEREDEVTALWRDASDHYEFGNLQPHDWVRRIAARGLDALLFLDVGMHPTPQVLAAYRLAPLQCMMWGHPVTSGSPEMDLFLSSDAMEPQDGQAHYCERLVRLPRLGISYPASGIEPDPAFHSPWSDESDVVHFFLGQTVFKLTPEHDEVLARIAEQLPQARFTLLPHWREPVRLTLERRMRGAFDARGLEFDRQVRLLPLLRESEFLALVRGVDVNLDSLGWSGGNSTLEITWFDVPTVTLPRALMRSRHSAAMMTLMGLDELIAKDVDDYVAIAVALGRDAGRRAELRARIAARKHVLYDDAGAVAAFADALEAGVRERA